MDTRSIQHPRHEAPIADVLECIDEGLLWLDRNFCIAGFNQAYLHLLELDAFTPLIGRPFKELLQQFEQEGDQIDGVDPAKHIADCMHRMQRQEDWQAIRIRPTGTVLKVKARPLPDGGYVFTYTDISVESRAFEELRRNAKATVVAFANFSEHRDTDTGAHVLRVARLVGETARLLQQRGHFSGILDDAYIDQVATASILHDVGKIATPDRILFKPGPLDAHERNTMRQHAVDGARMLTQASLLMDNSRYLELGAEIALTHHEWHDGSGYPNGLAGEEIPLSGRLCALADVFDALTSRRPYKAPWKTLHAIEQIRSLSGRQFDPVVVEAFLEVVEGRNQVKLVNWQPEMSVGNTHIDEQHQILIDTINQLANAEIRNDRAIVAMIIDELINYTVFHFEYEEDLIAAANYPDLEQHRRIHQGFVRWIRQVREEFTYHSRRQLGSEILGYLRDWLRKHILGEDQRYRPFLDNAEND
ncbi:bacteriohemerythrin [Azonexus sp.]|uniref:bacteriohemerythrin n=1 Tax=Azonexus sp. TaxID=1872668 RepID=UPI0039E2C8FD